MQKHDCEPKLTKEEKKFRAHVTRLFEWLVDALALREWHLELHFCAPDGEDVSADIFIDNVYLSATVRAGSEHMRRFFKEGNSWELMHSLTHEMCHLFTEPLYVIAVGAVTQSSHQFLKDTHERQAQRISFALMRLIPDEVYQIG